MNFTGTIDCPEFYASVQGELTNNLYIKNINPIMEERSINSQFFKSINHITNLYPITRYFRTVNYIKMIVFPLKFQEY